MKQRNDLPQVRAEMTAEQLCQALWGKDIEYVNLGYYDGTTIPLRRVPADAKVRVVAWSGGGLVEDDDGGWIADRFGPGLGHREAKRAVTSVSK